MAESALVGKGSVEAKSAEAPPALDDTYMGTYQLGAGEGTEPHLVFVGAFLGTARPTLHDFLTRRLGALTPLSKAAATVGPALFVHEPPELTLTFVPDDSGAAGLLWQPNRGALVSGTRVPLVREEVTFANGDVTLAGTLFLPPAGDSPPIGEQYPAVVLIHGSGPQTRQCVQLHAEYFAQHGIAALAYDKRGSGGSTPGRDDFRELGRDALAGLRLLRRHPRIDPRRIGLCGSSQGGWIAPIAAVEAPEEVAFVILVAGPAVSIAEQNRQNVEYSMRAAGFPAAQVEAGVRQALAFNELIRTGEGWEDFQALTRQAEAEGWLAYAMSPTMSEPPPRPVSGPRRGMDEDPTRTLERLRCPALALFGERDTTVPAVENLPPMEAALQRAGHPASLVRLFPGANHLFHEADPSGVFGRSRHFLPEYLQLMVDWVLRSSAVH